MSEDALLADAVSICRATIREGLGIECAFIDDNIALVVGLAQRAVLADLISDASETMQRDLKAAAEPFRERHERALGRSI